jgi:hypothetical protein
MVRKLFALTLVAMAVLAFVACGTDPATNVTPTTATLNGHGTCPQNQHANWWWEIRIDGDDNWLPWTKVGPTNRTDYPCQGENAQLRQAINTFPGTSYQYRIAVQQDGFGVLVCDSEDNCKTKGSADEANQVWESFTTPVHSENEVGKDYDVDAGSGSVSGAYACNVFNDLDPALIVGEVTYAQTYIDCRDDMWMKVTCKSNMAIYAGAYRVFYSVDVDYGDASSNNVCLSSVGTNTSIVNRQVSSRHDMYMRLNNTHRRWTSTFKRAFNRGGCNTYFTAENQHVLHCWERWGHRRPPLPEPH